MEKGSTLPSTTPIGGFYRRTNPGSQTAELAQRGHFLPSSVSDRPHPQHLFDIPLLECALHRTVEPVPQLNRLGHRKTAECASHGLAAYAGFGGWIGGALAHNIALKAHTRECFHEELHKDDKMTVTFQVGDREFGGAGNLEIDFYVRL